LWGVIDMTVRGIRGGAKPLLDLLDKDRKTVAADTESAVSVGFPECMDPRSLSQRVDFVCFAVFLSWLGTN
jgi:hypothetical protein